MQPLVQAPKPHFTFHDSHRIFLFSLGIPLLLLLLFSAIWATGAVSARIDATQVHEQTLAVIVAVMQTMQAFTPTATVTPTPTQTPTPTATPTSTPAPPPGTARINPIDGIIQIFIPEGNFLMGEGREIIGVDQDNAPEHAVYLDAYWISQTTITNAMYQQCYQAGMCRQPIRQELNPHYYDPAFANHPVVYVIWNDAEQYCEWSGGHLPTEAQWEKAARGTAGRLYPWGDYKPNASLANIGGDLDSTVPVGSYPRGASPYGVLDLGSNVREWVADWYQPNYLGESNVNPTGPETGDVRVLRGASWFDPLRYARVTSRLYHEPDSAGWNRGFRCAYLP